MKRTGVAEMPLHGGKCPPWLFERMSNLSREVVSIIVGEYGPDEMLRRISDPFWFQAFGCVLGFDWHSSGVTTTVGGALKDGLRGLEKDLGFFVCGGKGATSRKTPTEIEMIGDVISLDPHPLVYASRMSAKVDSTALQDGYQIYHHNFFFTRSGAWAVVQQGMNEETRTARRYHWLSEHVQSFVVEPHAAVCCDRTGTVLNMVAQEAEGARVASAELACQPPEKLAKHFEKLETLKLPERHHILTEDIDPKRISKIFLSTYECKPQTFEKLLAIPGVGPKTIRALALLSELVYGQAPSFRDPVRFSYAHGGKDAHPYPVDRAVYDRSISILHEALRKAKLGTRERLEAFRRLSAFESGS